MVLLPPHPYSYSTFASDPYGYVIYHHTLCYSTFYVDYVTVQYSNTAQRRTILLPFATPASASIATAQYAGIATTSNENKKEKLKTFDFWYKYTLMKSLDGFSIL